MKLIFCCEGKYPYHYYPRNRGLGGLSLKKIKRFIICTIIETFLSATIFCQFLLTGNEHRSYFHISSQTSKLAANHMDMTKSTQLLVQTTQYFITWWQHETTPLDIQSLHITDMTWQGIYFIDTSFSSKSVNIFVQILVIWNTLFKYCIWPISLMRLWKFTNPNDKAPCKTHQKRWKYLKTCTSWDVDWNNSIHPKNTSEIKFYSEECMYTSYNIERGKERNINA